jgi:hypothetical protein
MTLSFISSWTEFEAAPSERAPSLKTRHILAILIEAAFWVVMVGLLALVALGQARSAVFNVLLAIGVVLLTPSMRRKQLCSVTSPGELAGEIVVIALLTLGFLFLLSL